MRPRAARSAGRPAVAPGLDRAAWLLAVAPLLWIPQAALLALAIARIAAGGGAGAVVWPAAGILTLGVDDLTVIPLEYLNQIFKHV